MSVLPTAPSEIMTMNYNEDLAMLNRQRMRRVSEMIHELKQSCSVYNRKSRKRKRSVRASRVVKHVCNLITIPSIGVSLLLPVFAIFTVPIALTGTAITSICDVHQSRTLSRRRRYERIATSAQCTRENIEQLLTNVLLDGIVTEQEYELVVKCFDSFKETLRKSH